MEKLIRSVIDLDEKTDKMVQEKESSIDQEKSGLQKHFTEMETDEREEAKAIAKASYDKIFGESMAVVDEIMANNRQKLEKVDAVYKENKTDLVEEAFQLLDI